MASTAVSANKAASDWVTNINQFKITDSAIAYLDDSMKPAVRLYDDGSNLTADNLSSKLEKQLKISPRNQVKKSGQLSVDSNIAAQMKLLDLAIDAQNLSAPALQPYLTYYLTVMPSSNLASTKSKLELVPHSHSQKLATEYNGTLSLADFRALDKKTFADFLKLKLLGISGINHNIGDPQQHVTPGKIVLDNSYARIILPQSAKLNLQYIVVSKNVPPGVPTPSLTSAEAGEGIGLGTQKVTKPTAEGSTTIAPIAVAAPKESVPIN